jgi:alpha-tubulin suppressor-like RCC1 family protein
MASSRFSSGASAFALASCVFGSLALSACMFGVSYDGVFSATASDGGAETGIPDGGPPPVQATAVANGDGFSCALRVDGTVTCWGYNGSGRLGNATDLSASTPQLVKDVTDAAAVAAGGNHACVLRKSGAVACFGSNEQGQLGDGTTSSSRFPVTVQGLTDATQLALGYYHSCALRKDATVSCWGYNTSGQLGDGTTNGRSQPGTVTGLTDVTQIAAFGRGTCALVKAGEVYCWGYNDSGALGNGGAPNNQSAPVKVSSLTGITAIGAGANAGHVCAINGAGDVRCWGAGWEGALGNGDTSTHDTPVLVSLVGDATQIANGSQASCTVKKDGTLMCWGWNAWRQIGVGDKSPPYRVTTPITVAGISQVKSVAFGYDHVCAVWGAGRISCWGSDVDGRLGRGTRLFSSEPLKAVGLTGVTALGMGVLNGCSVAGGTLSCWGANWSGQLTDDNAIAATGTPLSIPSLANVKGTAVGNDHLCALLGDGTIKCVGSGYYGQLGQGGGSAGMPQTFAAGPAKLVSAGDNFTCALLQNGDAVCSGLNDNGRLGSPGGDAKTPVQVQIDGAPTYLGGATDLSAGNGHACAVASGTVWCWGTSWDGRAGTTDSTSAPKAIDLQSATAKAVTAGGTHSCAILADGSVRCWGGNDDGQITGSGGGPTPRAVPLAKTAKAISAGRAHTCAILDDGAVWCWGAGRLGQLGNGGILGSATPVQVKGLANAVLLSAHDDSTCATVQDGTVWCWGENPVGELADGSVFTSGVPGSVVGY